MESLNRLDVRHLESCKAIDWLSVHRGDVGVALVSIPPIMPTLGKIDTSAMNGQDVFSLARLLLEQVSEEKQLLFWIREMGIFTGEEEEHLFSVYLSAVCPSAVGNRQVALVLDPAHRCVFVSLVAMCIFYAWDFAVAGKSKGSLAFYHSHDVGIEVLVASEHVLMALGEWGQRGQVAAG